MNVQKDILNNINTRYVLVKKNNEYIIVDKLRRSMVILDDPIINKNELVKAMISKRVEVYDNIKSLPLSTEKSIYTDESRPDSFKIFIKKIYDDQNKQTGAIITALTSSLIGKEEKHRIERIMEQYSFNVLFPNDGLNIFSNTYSDTASIVVIKNINSLPNELLDNSKDLYNW